MASLGGLTTSVLHHRCHRRRWRLTSASRFLGDPACFVNSISLSTLCSSSNFPTLSSTHRAHLFHSPLGFPSKPYLKTRCCRVGCPSPPAAVPQPDPPPVKNQQPFAGINFKDFCFFSLSGSLISLNCRVFVGNTSTCLSVCFPRFNYYWYLLICIEFNVQLFLFRC
ncbi:hypothetical protein Dimus_004408 [Dionaea muscipula]